MELYKSETAEILRLYAVGEISRHECINRLDAAVAGLFPRMTAKDSTAFQSEMLVTEEALRDTTTKRRQYRKRPA